MNRKRLIFFVLFFLVLTIPLYQAKGEGSSVSLGYLNANLPDNITVKVKDYGYKLTKADITKWIRESTRLTYNPNYLSEIENPHYCEYKKSIMCKLAFATPNARHIQKESAIIIDGDAVNNFLAVLAQKVNRNPEDAKLKMEEGKVSVFSLGNKGLELDQEKSAIILADYIKGGNYADTIDLPYKETSPEISDVGSIDDLGVNSLIGEGRSNFRGSTKNRIFNIKVATARYNGVLIKPGEEFSFVKILGEVDGDHGYLPELVIKKDKTEPEFGGGICQVSTTAFRAALNAGLEVTARRNHAYPVSYYSPQGTDATVYVPRPDLKFKNNTPRYILIQTKIEGTELIFDFYGTNDGRKVELTGPTVLERNPDGSMKTTLNQKVWNANGDIIIDDDFPSNYDSPSKYPHPATTNDILTQKPNGWSDNEWAKYKQAHGM